MVVHLAGLSAAREAGKATAAATSAAVMSALTLVLEELCKQPSAPYKRAAGLMLAFAKEMTALSMAQLARVCLPAHVADMASSQAN